jgi:hypothetical protein
MDFYAKPVRILYVSIVRPHLEFAVPVWNPYMTPPRFDIKFDKNVKMFLITPVESFF